MRRSILLAVIAIPVLLIAFVCGALAATYYRLGSPIATVNVINESGREVESIVVTYTTCGHTKKLIYRQAEQRELIEPAKEIQMQLVLCGEGGYQTEVTFHGGQMLTTGESYIQGGDVINEFVSVTGIKSEHEYSRP